MVALDILMGGVGSIAGVRLRHRGSTRVPIAAVCVLCATFTAVPVGAGASGSPYPPVGSSSGYQDTSFVVPTNGQLRAEWTNPSAITCEQAGYELVAPEAYVGGVTTTSGSTVTWNVAAFDRFYCANGTLQSTVATISIDTGSGGEKTMTVGLGDHLAVRVDVPAGPNATLSVSLTDTTSGQSESLSLSHVDSFTINDLFVGMDPTGIPKKIPRFGSVSFTDCVFHGQPLLDVANMTQVEMMNTRSQPMIVPASYASGKGFRDGFRNEGILAVGD
jgi:hypothetical protein